MIDLIGVTGYYIAVSMTLNVAEVTLPDGEPLPLKPLNGRPKRVSARSPQAGRRNPKQISPPHKGLPNYSTRGRLRALSGNDERASFSPRAGRRSG